MIPTRNRWDILGETLEGLQAQTVAGFETIVVADGTDQEVPAAVSEKPGVRVLVQEHAGPGVARNLGAGATERPLVLFLGDDIVPTPELVVRHLDRHGDDGSPEVAVLGHIDWHPTVADNRLLRWLDWSGSQFDYRLLVRQGTDEAGFGRFYSSNVSLKRQFFLDAGGFDPDFRFDYEDLDLGWRLDQRGMRLLYEPRAVAHHLHCYDWGDIVRRYESRARAEQLMAAKHDWFSPWFYGRITTAAGQRRVSRLWATVVDRVPERAGPLRRYVEAKADRWYAQRLAPAFLTAWENERDLEDLGPT